MDFILSDNVKVRYSKGERRIFAALNSKKRAHTEEVLNAIYGRGGSPFHGRQIVLGSLNSLLKKIDVNREKFRLRKGERSGPYSIEWWLEKRK